MKNLGLGGGRGLLAGQAGGLFRDGIAHVGVRRRRVNRQLAGFNRTRAAQLPLRKRRDEASALEEQQQRLADLRRAFFQRHSAL